MKSLPHATQPDPVAADHTNGTLLLTALRESRYWLRLPGTIDTAQNRSIVRNCADNCHSRTALFEGLNNNYLSGLYTRLTRAVRFHPAA